MKAPRRVRVLVNRKSGLPKSFESLRKAFEQHWPTSEFDLSYQFCHNREDGIEKARRAVEQKFDILVAAGGDGTVNTIGSVVNGSDTTLAVIPTGSGNGFARHFGIPLKAKDAARVLASGTIRKIDVGFAGEHPFLVSCSLAWDAALVRAFEKSPVRGILPYIFAAVHEYIDYKPERIVATTDTGEVLEFSDPIVYTIANLTQYGGGAIISPDAEPDDGMLELVVACQQDLPILLANVAKIFNGSIQAMPRVTHRRFRTLTVERPSADQIQIDGELVDVPSKFTISVQQESLNVLLPSGV